MEVYSGKNAIIFGGSSGIGLATAHLLCRRGAKVTVADLKPPLGGHIDGISWIGCDVREQQQVEAAVQAAAADGLHWLVYSAGIQHYGTVTRTSVDEYDLVQAVNARGAFLAAKASIPQMNQGGGAIVLVSSVQALACQERVAAYAASKGTLEALTRAIAVDHARDHIRVNSVMPGTVDTPMVRSSANSLRGNGLVEEVLEEWGKFHPIQRVAQPEEIAQVIAFLLSDEASFLTGSSYRVDGGLLAQLPVRL